jgi:hypothetical protein
MDQRQKLEFENILRQAGKPPLFSCDGGENDLQILCSRYRQYEQAWIDQRLKETHTKQPGIAYGFIESFDFQAYAMQNPSSHEGFIAVTPTCVTCLRTFFRNALSLPHVLTEVGNPSSEREQKEQRDIDPTSIKPIDSERANIADMLTIWAVRFLTAHEMRHILNGHLRFTNKYYSEFAISEANSVATSDIALERQTFEMDADSGAAYESLRGVLRPSLDKRFLQTQTFHPVYYDVRLVLKLWSFCVCSLFRLFDTNTALDFQILTHPPCGVRTLMIQANALEILKAHKLSQFNSTLVKSFEDVLIQSGMVTSWLKNDGTAFHPLQVPQTNFYPNALLQKWRQLRPALEPLSTSANKLAPAIL